MSLQLDFDGLERYKSRSQRARVATQAWAREHLTCIKGCGRLEQTAENHRATDFICPSCKEAYELKSGRSPFGKQILGGSFKSMEAAIKSSRAPNLVYLHHDEKAVRNLVVIPNELFTVDCIRKRPALSAKAKRKGWEGCLILCERIPEVGRIHLVSDGVTMTTSAGGFGAISRASRTTRRVLAPHSNRRRGWFFAVLAICQKFPRTFSLSDLYKWEDELAQAFPNNRNIRAKIRQQLQELRDAHKIEFVRRGRYQLKKF